MVIEEKAKALREECAESPESHEFRFVRYSKAERIIDGPMTRFQCRKCGQLISIREESLPFDFSCPYVFRRFLD